MGNPRKAEELGLEPSASDMVGFNFDRPSCQLAAFRVHGIDPFSGSYILHADGSVYKRTKAGTKRIKTKVG